MVGEQIGSKKNSRKRTAREKYPTLVWCIDEYCVCWKENYIDVRYDDKFGYFNAEMHKLFNFRKEYMIRIVRRYGIDDAFLDRLKREYADYMDDPDVFSRSLRFEGLGSGEDPNDKGRWDLTVDYVAQALAYSKATGPRHLYRYSRRSPQANWIAGRPPDCWWLTFDQLDPDFGAVIPLSYVVKPIDAGCDAEDLAAAQFERLRLDIDWANWDLDRWVSAFVEMVDVILNGPWPFPTGTQPILEPGIRCRDVVYDRTDRYSLLRDRLLINDDMREADALAHLARLKDYVVLLHQTGGEARLGRGLETVERGYQAPTQGPIADWAARFRQSEMPMEPDEAAAEIDSRLAPVEGEDFNHTPMYMELDALRRLANIYTDGNYELTRLEILRKWHGKKDGMPGVIYGDLDLYMLYFIPNLNDEYNLGKFDFKTLLASRDWGKHAFETPYQAGAWLMEAVCMATGLAKRGADWQPGDHSHLF